MSYACLANTPWNISRKVSGKVLEYLGREDKIDPVRLRKAVEYWGVTTRAKRKARKGGRG